MEAAHLPAYRKAGLEVTGAFDRDVEKARAFAARHGIARIYDSLDALAADERVAVVDVAITPWDQPALVERLLAAGKHVLAQKPLAPDGATAAKLAESAERAGRKLAVNQQLRFDEGIAAARAMVESGWIGTPLMLEMTIDITIEWTPWINDFEQVQLWYHAIHELDAIRSILGDPLRVWCAGAKRPGQKPRGETRVLVGMVFAGELRAMVHVNSENLTGTPTATFRIDGTEGTIRGRLERFYGAGGPDTLELWSRTLPTDGWQPYRCTQTWFPDAFIGPMRSLLNAIATGGEPFTSARDNVNTIRLIEALYRSMDSGEAQRLSPRA
ncbi:MAG: Gfo/Idh/MocA family oxidoreductase [Candidatus Eremiobacteraeota bacterium]|nr:Gfo/Idh/MocA family oxidoreductase [Candidatus Eremiobacteraeota bacterium]